MSNVGKNPGLKGGVIQLDRKDALESQWKLIYEWKPKNDVWPYRYGPGILSGLSSITAFSIASHYNKKLKLFHRARFPMYFPTIAFSAFVVSFIHPRLVSEEIILQTSCPVCIQVRAATIQIGAGILYPLLMSPAAGFLLGTIYATYDVPLFKWKNIGEILSLWYKLSLPLKNKLPWLLATQIIAAFTITNFEASSYFKIQKKIAESSRSQKL